MNILLLTPDAVGGTFLKQMLTVYMQLHKFDKPVIDVGHIELGLETYYCPTFNQEILRCSADAEYKTMQSLVEIQELLESVDHHKIIKLPHYNIVARKDPVKEQVPFYRYLNENYFIIACRRNNLFEHALSWSLNKITKTLNVFSVDEKIRAFGQLYCNGVNIDPLSVKQSLDTYKKYINWSEDNFRISSYYHYENDSANLEKYILSLPVFGGQQKHVTWAETFGISLANWNKCHYYQSDIGALKKDNLVNLSTAVPSLVKPNNNIAQNTKESWQNFVSAYNIVADPLWPKINTVSDWENLPDNIKNECLNVHDIGYYLESAYINKNLVETSHSNHYQAKFKINQIKQCIADHHSAFLTTHMDNYKTALGMIAKMVDLGILSKYIPIKKQTLAEKRRMINNFAECVEAYNVWIDQNPTFGSQVTEHSLLQHTQAEQQVWGTDSNNKNLLPDIKLNFRH
jgi:hypothetical protein